VPQESRERKLENGIALKMARIVCMFKTRTIVYSTYNNNNFIPHKGGGNMKTNLRYNKI